MIMPCEILIGSRNVSHKIVEERQNTHFISSMLFLKMLLFVRLTCCFILYYNNYSGHHFMQIYGLAAHYRLDGPGFKPQWGQDFPYPSWLTPRPNRSPVQWVPGVSSLGKAGGLWQWPPNPSKCQSWVWMELYLYLPSLPSLHVMEPFT